MKITQGHVLIFSWRIMRRQHPSIVPYNNEVQILHFIVVGQYTEELPIVISPLLENCLCLNKAFHHIHFV